MREGQRDPDALTEHFKHQFGNWIARPFTLPPGPNPTGIGLDVPVSPLPGALSYGGGQPGVVKTCAPLPVDETMIRGPITCVIAHQSPSKAASDPWSLVTQLTVNRGNLPAQDSLSKRLLFAYPGSRSTPRPAPDTLLVFSHIVPLFRRLPVPCRFAVAAQELNKLAEGVEVVQDTCLGNRMWNSRPALTGLQSLQDATLGEPKVCVAVLDGPVDLSHPCFHGAKVRRLNTLVQDPAGGGPMSVHGTHIASMIFGQPGSPVPGIAPHCQGVVAPVFGDSQERRLSQLDLARAIEQAVQEGAHVINISGGEQSPGGQAEGVLRRALQLCEDSNVLVVAAVGNDGCACLHVPAAVPSTIGVGALGEDGKPLLSSNWGESYKSNGILAPGENISGAAPGGGIVSMTGSSFATPIVSAVAALLLSLQVQQGRRPDPRAVGKALLESAVPCSPPDSPDCRRYLAGTLNIPGAYASVGKGGKSAMTTINTTEALTAPAVLTASDDGAGIAATPRTGITAAALGDRSEGYREAAPADGAPEAAETGIAAAASEIPAQPATVTAQPVTIQATDGASPSSDSVSIEHSASPSPGHSPYASLNSVVPAGGCGCGNGKRSYVYSIGNVGFDFGTEADRDAFRQLMPRLETGRPPVSAPPNPYDVVQLVTYLDNNPWESTNLIWTLNLDLTPIYAIEAETAYADEVYKRLREALRNEALPSDNDSYVSRVSIPGVLTSRTRRLFSGQVVPVVVAGPRGINTWNETALVNAVIQAVSEQQEGTNEDSLRLTISMLLDKIYYQFRNLGQTSPDRALNYAGTNAFVFAEGIQNGLLSARVVPGADDTLYTIDTITVAKSPYCRIDSDCWDVQITFFSPANNRSARCVYQYTIDVSKEMPVSLAPTHQFLVAPSVTLVT
jgi:cyanobactin maturation PatA/PatG family protease